MVVVINARRLQKVTGINEIKADTGNAVVEVTPEYKVWQIAEGAIELEKECAQLVEIVAREGDVLGIA